MKHPSQQTIAAAQAPADFLTLPHWRAIAVAETGHAYEVEAVPLSEPSTCPRCGGAAAALRPCGTRRQSIRDAPVRGKHVTIHFVRRLYKCRECGHNSRQPLTGVDTRRRVTTRLVELVGTEAFGKTYSLVSKETGVSPPVVGEIFLERVSELERSVRPEAPRVIGLDEVYVRGRAHCLLTDLVARRPLEILSKPDMLTLCGYLLQLPQRDSVEAVVIDWRRSHLEVVRRVLPQAAVVINKWGVWQLARQTIFPVVQKVRAGSPAERRFRLAQASRYLQKGYSRLTGHEHEVLTELFRREPELGEAYHLRRRFFAIWSLKSRQEAERQYAEWLNDIPPNLYYAFGGIVRTIGSWHQEVFNYFDYPLTNAYTESVAHKLKMLHSISPASSLRTVRAKVLYEGLVKRPLPSSTGGNTVSLSLKRKGLRVRPRARRAPAPATPTPTERSSATGRNDEQEENKKAGT